MKIIKKVPHGNGHIYVYFMGIKIASYKPKHFVMGKNNVVKIPDNVDVQLKIFGNNNTVIIEDTPLNPHVSILIGMPGVECNNCVFHMGKNCSIGSMQMWVGMREDGTKIEIGEDCMFSVGISLFPSDAHAILDDKGNVTNIGKHIKIGNHVWAGGYVTICKNSEIADGCVIGTQSVVSGKFTEPNCILAGNPARVVKKNITWDRRTAQEMLNKQNVF